MTTIPGQIISIGSLLLSSLSGVNGIVEEASDPATLAPDFEQVYDAAPQFTASAEAALSLTLKFTSVSTYAQKTAILRALNYPHATDLLTLRAYVGDPSAPVAAQIPVAINEIDPQPGVVTVEVTAQGGVWTAIIETVVGPYSFADTGAAALTSVGQAVTYGTYKIDPTAQRTTLDASLGWKYRRQVTITNSTDKDWVDRPQCVDLDNTGAWVTALKAQASGADIRVRKQGYDFARTLVNFNTRRTFLWFLASIKSGASETYDVLYGNALASAYLDLDTYTGSRPTYVAFDLEGITGTATSGTSSSLTNGALSMETNRWRDGYIQILSGTGANQIRRIASNTGVTFNVTRNWSTSPDNTSVYAVWRSGVAVDGGRVSARTASTMTDSSQVWNTNEWVGATVSFIGGSTGTKAVVTSNTPTVLTISGTFGTQPAVNDSYVIQRYGQHTYNVDPSVYAPTHEGLWRQNRWYSKPSVVWIHNNPTPGGWAPTLYLDNDDDFAQSRTYALGTGGGHSENWRGIGRARRRLHQSAIYPDEGQADGIATYVPEGLQGISFDYKLKNENGVGQFVLSVLEPGGESWRDVVANSTRYKSLTAGTQAVQWRDLSNDNNPIRLYMGVLPVDGVGMTGTVTDTGEVTGTTATTDTDSSKNWETNVWAGGTVTFGPQSLADPKASTVSSNTATVLTVPTMTTQPPTRDPYTLTRPVLETDEVEFRTGSRLYLTLDLDGIGGLTDGYFQIGSEESVYDLNAKLRIGGGTLAVPPFDRCIVGGKNGHWLTLSMTGGEELWITTDPDAGRPLLGVYDASDALVYAAPWAGRFFRVETNDLGDDVDIVSRAILPIPPGNNLLTNGGFEASLSGWTAGSTTGGMTAAWTRDTVTTFGGSAGALKVAVSATPAGPWSSSYVLAVPVSVVAGETWDATAVTRTTDVTLNARITVALTSAPTTVTESFDFPFPDTLTWYPIGAGAVAPDDLGTGAATALVTFTVYGSGSGHSGSVWFDTAALGSTALYVSETAIGVLGIEVDFSDRYLS